MTLVMQKAKSSGAGAQRVRGLHTSLEAGRWWTCAEKGPSVLAWAAHVLKLVGTEKISVGPAQDDRQSHEAFHVLKKENKKAF